MSQVVVKPLTDASINAWNHYVDHAERSTFFHRAEWKEVLKQAFGHDSHYLYAERDDRITGILPLGQVKSWLFGNALISVPFCVYGGVVANDEDSRQALLKAACSLAQELQVDYLELRNLYPETLPEKWQRKELYVTFRKPLLATDDENLKAIPRKQRAMVRKGIKAGLSTVIEKDTHNFFYAYSSSVRNLGTPVFNQRYFDILLQAFPDHADILTVKSNDKVVASVLNFYFKDQVLPFYGGGTEHARQCAGNDFMYWELMSHALKKGAAFFDFGRSKKDTGAFSFKKNWGFTPEPLYYDYFLVKADHLPNISPNNPKYKLFIQLWSKLPLKLSQLIGPMVSKYLG
ncbi:FemAB family PEP-CTERM system-associated protein [Zooshikella marina]|uniref:FemAB family XrtA/PEP-CTERM system-associated protein n=1 Tax=Zooshikella ganghwensis TaxID=202772 RepID=UPI001BAFDD6D|nr:FemAB family XrtA/PEP-CTERM system-associated protein [Zooshikella ganghwensis]MBU2704440.1 FemAB family PEP-CTERM system-associated protein [Zooshikella ganghwensis]